MLPQVKEFEYLRVLFASEGEMEQEIYRLIGAEAAVIWQLYWTVVVKRELSLTTNCSFTSRSTFQPSPMVISFGERQKEGSCRYKWPK